MSRFYSESYKWSLYEKYRTGFTLPEICEISETYNEIERQILNEDILDVLRTVNWYYSYWEERK